MVLTGEILQGHLLTHQFLRHKYGCMIHSRVLPTTDVSNVLLNYICPLGLNPRLNNHTKPSYDIMIWIIFKN